jgi:hypothetical protein
VEDERGIRCEFMGVVGCSVCLIGCSSLGEAQEQKPLTVGEGTWE